MSEIDGPQQMRRPVDPPCRPGAGGTCARPEPMIGTRGRDAAMKTTSGTPRARRFTLLIGMLLHLLGVAAIPFHVWAPADPVNAPASVAERHDDGSSLPAHDELHCVLCHASSETALPPHGAELFVAAAVRRAETPADHAAPSHRPASPARARAPPLA